MTVPLSLKPFSTTAPVGFPKECEPIVKASIGHIATFVDTSYTSDSVFLSVSGQQVEIPKRIHFQLKLTDELAFSTIQKSSLPIQCLLTRSTDGYIRQLALTKIIAKNEPWVLPYVVLLAGEYVVEITEVILASLEGLDQDAYAKFVHENRPMINRLKSQATSYWDCYHRRRFPDRNVYPGLRFLNQIEKWAHA
jgi:hypothetical protein